MKILNIKLLKLKKHRYPICPECGENSIVLFTPPKKGIVGTKKGYETLGTPEYIDWERAHLYCCNDANCTFNTRLFDLTTPIKNKVDSNETHTPKTS